MSKAIQEPERIKETIGFTLEGITVYTSIDYRTRQISLVEKDGQKKKWLFAERTPGYFSSWQRILNAMKNAIELAEARLEEQPDMMESLLLEEALKGRREK